MTRKQTLLVDAARELFFKHGIRRISIKEICEKAGVSKVTFYRYYTDKNDLARFIRDELMGVGVSKFDEITASDISYGEKVDLMTDWRREFFSGMSPDFIEDIFLMEDFNEIVKERFSKMIQSAQEKGEIKKELSPELIWQLSQKIHEMVSDGSWRNVAIDYSEYQSQIRLLFFHGLLVNKQ